MKTFVKTALTTSAMTAIMGLSSMAAAETNVVGQIQYDTSREGRSLFLRAEDGSWGTGNCQGNSDDGFVFINTSDESYETVLKFVLTSMTTGQRVSILAAECEQASNGRYYGKITYFTF